MRVVYRGLLLAAMVIASSAITVAPASAQIEVSYEDSFHCHSVVLIEHNVAGGCQLGISSVSWVDLYQHVTTPIAAEVLFSSCFHDFLARIDESGQGYAYFQNFFGASCGLQPCSEPAPSHANLAWPMRIEEPAPGAERMHMVFCMQQTAAAEGTGTPCEVQIPMSEIGNSHEYQLGPVTQTPCINLGGVVEISGNWVSNTVLGAVEMNH